MILLLFTTLAPHLGVLKMIIFDVFFEHRFGMAFGTYFGDFGSLLGSLLETILVTFWGPFPRAMEIAWKSRGNHAEITGKNARLKEGRIEKLSNLQDI